MPRTRKRHDGNDLYHDACEALDWETSWEYFEKELETATLPDLQSMYAQIQRMTA